MDRGELLELGLNGIHGPRWHASDGDVQAV